MLTVMFENEAQGSIKPAQKGKAAAPAHKENAPIANIKGRGAKPVGRGNGGKGLGVLWKLWLPARREHVSDLVVSKNEDQKHAGVRCLNGIAFNDSPEQARRVPTLDAWMARQWQRRPKLERKLNSSVGVAVREIISVSSMSVARE